MSNHEVMDNSIEANENGFSRLADEAPSFEEHMERYKAKHPEAVEDIDKARAIAESTNTLESRLAKTKRLASRGDLDSGYASEQTEYLRDLADKKAEAVAMDFDYQTKRRGALLQRLEQEETSGRIEDIEKARAMAEASNFHETAAARTKAQMNDMNYDNDPDYFDRSWAEESYERFRKAADRKAEEAAQKYDEESK